MDEKRFTGDLAGAHFEDGDLSGAVFREVDLSRARFSGVMLSDVEIDGALSNLVVNGIRIDELVRDELERREPDRVLLRGRSVHELTRGWEACRERWVATEQLLASLPSEAASGQVDGEWSALQTIRHLVFVTDAWFSRSILGLPDPFHPWGLPPEWVPDQAAMGVDPAADPSLDELTALRAEQAEQVVEWLEQASDDDLELPCVASDEPGYPADPSGHTIGDALRVVLSEEFEHHRFCRRDLASAGWTPQP